MAKIEIPVPNILQRFRKYASIDTLFISWLGTLFILGVALLQTWNFLPPVLGKFIIGVFMFIGGVDGWIEAYQGGGITLSEPSDVTSILTGSFSLLYGIGLVFKQSFMITHFGGVQGGVLALIFVDLVYEGLDNRT